MFHNVLNMLYKIRLSKERLESKIFSKRNVFFSMKLNKNAYQYNVPHFQSHLPNKKCGQNVPFCSIGYIRYYSRFLICSKILKYNRSADWFDDFVTNTWLPLVDNIKHLCTFYLFYLFDNFVLK